MSTVEKPPILLPLFFHFLCFFFFFKYLTRQSCHSYKEEDLTLVSCG